MISKLFKILLLLLLLGIIIYYALAYIYGKEDSPWQSDAIYLQDLLISKTTGADTVDDLRVYKVRRKHFKWYSLEELSTKEVVSDTKDRRRIEEFVSAANEWMDVGDSEVPFEDRFPASKGCSNAFSREVESDKFYVAMYDKTLMRADYFITAVCEYQGKEYLRIMVPAYDMGGSIVYYNEALLPVFRELGIL
jgi:hypothetical protein